MQAGSNLRTIAEEEIPTFAADAAPPTPPRGQRVISEAVLMALRVLSQRALIAIGALADLLLIGSAFVLWLLIIAQPNVLQLIGVGLYAAFISLTLLTRHRGSG